MQVPLHSIQALPAPLAAETPRPPVDAGSPDSSERYVTVLLMMGGIMTAALAVLRLSL